MKKDVFTCESVSAGHPDKLCDAVSDAILDACLEQDPFSRVACETTANKDVVRVMGEITTDAVVDVESVVRKKVIDIGYDQPVKYFDGNTCKVIVDLNKQSCDIAMGVDNSDIDNTGAGDQGMMFGYAIRETESYMPYPLVMAHNLMKRLEVVRKTMFPLIIYPDAKSQITVEYNAKSGKIDRIKNIVLSSQHSYDISVDDLYAILKEHVIEYVFDGDKFYTGEEDIFCNPTGRFCIGGPFGDSGLTGRKIIVDTYGGYAPHGGGAFSGKDSTKVDRSGAYMARYLAKNIVATGLTDECTVQLAYVIGVAQPVSFCIECDLPDSEIKRIKKVILDNVDLRPNKIIEKFGLRSPIFSQTSAYGHFGNDSFPWEKLDLVDYL